MALFKARTTNTNTIWDSKKRYKVNSNVVYNNILYQNITGKNSAPDTLVDWVILKNGNGGVNSDINHTQLTYTSSTKFTKPQNAQIKSVVINELRHLNATKYTYNPLLSTNNFEITDPTFLLDWEAGTEIEIVTQ